MNERSNLKFMIWSHAQELKITLPTGWLDRFCDDALELGFDPIREFRRRATLAGWIVPKKTTRRKTK